jgi:hypothetical protein
MPGPAERRDESAARTAALLPLGLAAKGILSVEAHDSSSESNDPS